MDIDGRILISDRAHVLFDVHKEMDGLREAELKGGKIGTTKRGIGPAYSSKTTRCAHTHMPLLACILSLYCEQNGG